MFNLACIGDATSLHGMLIWVRMAQNPQNGPCWAFFGVLQQLCVSPMQCDSVNVKTGASGESMYIRHIYIYIYIYIYI